jgi:hypothetical protein
MLPPRVAGKESLKSQPATFEGAILLYGFQPVGAASGGKPALGAKEWGYSPLVKADNDNEQGRKETLSHVCYVWAASAAPGSA